MLAGRGIGGAGSLDGRAKEGGRRSLWLVRLRQNRRLGLARGQGENETHTSCAAHVWCSLPECILASRKNCMVHTSITVDMGVAARYILAAVVRELAGGVDNGGS